MCLVSNLAYFTKIFFVFKKYWLNLGLNQRPFRDCPCAYTTELLRTTITKEIKSYYLLYFRMNVDEAVSYLEQLIDEDTTGEIQSADVFIEPPGDGTGSDEDSADEETESINNLSGRHLRSQATVAVHRMINNDESSESDNDEEIARQPAKKTCIRQYVPQWKKGKLPAGNTSGAQRYSWNLPSPKLQLHDSPATIFEKFFTDEIIQFICDESNKYAVEKGGTGFNLDPSTFRLFLSTLIISGYSPLPRRRMYWEYSRDVLNTAISDSMSRNAFEEILRYLHLADNAQLDANDKFSKVRPVMNHINKKCQENFVAEQIISIDESMIPYFGRHSAKQFIHGKPIRFGYKAWVAATRLGYVVAFDLYQGKGTTDKELGLGGSVVMNLFNQLPEKDNRHYHFLFDNFFTNIDLLNYLQSIGTGATGTVRANRDKKAPLKAITIMEKQERGSYDSAVDEKSNITVVRWKDNKVVTVASTYAGVEPIGVAQRFVRNERRRVGVPIPHCFQIYNHGMGGVDRFDQNVACYMINIRTKKWWWPMFRFLIDLSVQNAFQLYRLQDGVDCLDLLGFRRSIVETYISKYSPQRPRNAYAKQSVDKRVQDDIRYDRENHWPSKGKQHRCGLQSCKGTSVYFCSKCNIALHPECFEKFHTK